MIKSLNEYQTRASDTWTLSNEADDAKRFAYLALGLTNEAGEVAGKLKKVIRGDKLLNDDVRMAIAHEIGDVLWYASQLGYEIGYSLEEIATMNIDKLRDRNLRGVIKGDGDNR